MLQKPKIDILHVDNMEYMRSQPDNAFDLAIVDPPYGINAGKGVGRSNRLRFENNKKNWDESIPTKEFFDELLRVSKHQIIWGGNYFIDYLYSSRCFIIWDKVNAGRDFADCEMAWTSFDKVARIFKYRVATDAAKRIHPTQKPVALYRYLIQNYAEKGWRLLDTNGGSCNSAAAAYSLGFDMVVCEMDDDHYRDGLLNFNNLTGAKGYIEHENGTKSPLLFT